MLLDPLDTTEGEELHGQVDDGLFEFDHVAAGTYRLRILMPEEEVFIRQIVVGDALRS